MTETTETQKAAGFIVSKITADTGSGGIASAIGGRIYNGKAVAGTAFPCIIFSCIPDSDVKGVGGGLAYTTLQYNIRVCSTSHFGTIDAIAARLTTLLHGKTATGIQYCERLRLIERAYTEDNIDYYERGGVFKITVLQGG